MLLMSTRPRQTGWPDAEPRRTRRSRPGPPRPVPSPEVRQGRVDAWVRDAHVDDALDPGDTRCFEQGHRVGDRQGVVDPTAGETDPVGVVERRHTFERRGEAGPVREVERPDSDHRTLGRSLGMAGECPDTPARVEQQLRDGVTRVTECSRHDVQPGVRRTNAGIPHGLRVVRHVINLVWGPVMLFRVHHQWNSALTPVLSRAETERRRRS